MHGTTGHGGAVPVVELTPVAGNDAFDGFLNRLALSAFAALAEFTVNLDMDAKLEVHADAGVGLDHNLSRLFTTALSARGTGSPSLMKL